MIVDIIPVNQVWDKNIITPLGNIYTTHRSQIEFYQGDYLGTIVKCINDNMFYNPYLKILKPTNYNVISEPWNGYPHIFLNSIFDVTINNVLNNRINQKTQKSEYNIDLNIPDNLELILQDKAVRASVPLSNYSTLRIISPRYLGSKVFSSDYNHYTPGDYSYGSNAVIDNYPRYFAHFRWAKENKEFWDTATYKIDALIEVPHELIIGTIEEPKVLKIENDNQRLYEVTNNFWRGRKVKVDFNSEIYEEIDYQTIENEPQTIFLGGSKYKLICGNEINKQEYYEECHFLPSTWNLMFSDRLIDVRLFLSSNFATELELTPKGNIDLIPRNHGKNWFISTGSNSFVLEGGELGISSPIEYNGIEQILTWGPGLGLIHTHNQSLYRGLLNNTDIDDFRIGIPKNLPNNSLINNINNKDNYIRFTNYSPGSVDLRTYEEYRMPFLVLPGDEIRITFIDSSVPVSNYVTQDFLVIDIGTSLSEDYKGVPLLASESEYTCPRTRGETGFFYILPESGSPEDYFSNWDTDPIRTDCIGGGEFVRNEWAIECADPTGNTCPDPSWAPPPGFITYEIWSVFKKERLTYSSQNDAIVNPESLLDKIYVYPNPEDYNISEGKIWAFTIRRRVDADNSVIVYQSPPVGSDGFLTLSDSGFLIPNDFNQIQKDNVATLINNLKEKNVF